MPVPIETVPAEVLLAMVTGVAIALFPILTPPVVPATMVVVEPATEELPIRTILMPVPPVPRSTVRAPVAPEPAIFTVPVEVAPLPMSI